ncbi:Gfo/Idh/MocA family protein [Celeribacter halophilus]|uniref:Gfo/Idh/MocA family protein n=1 Tax=Celeribacter halophilus TaxID=576117 RepID=UPI001C0998B9|nr:Gfo/Idh/MocA family oxidoreductase [Celeribacter halophilus]MBU2888081.1 Gfo/Idh/MocA family oxidoreductase [Celeribacter halophilus]MDO6511852.1 Gfo/Idh/MocA family oxidoreductase [Celeribacter halophilus]
MKIGIVGLGDRIASLLPRIKEEHSDAEFVAVADPSDARMPVLAALGAAPTRYDDASEMLSAHRFDLLIVGSPNHLHLDHLRLALQTDVPFIFAEKPLVISVEESLELARLVAAHNGQERIMVGMVLRYSPLYRALRQAQADGHLGEIMSIEASEHIAPYHGSFFMRDWRRNSDMSGGFMLEKCCHDLDLYQGVVGARARKVASFGGRKKYLPEHRPVAATYLDEKLPRWSGVEDAFSGGGDLIDYQTALIQYENGASMSFHTNLNVPDEFRRFAVIGRDGMAEGDFIRNTFKVTLSDTGDVPVESMELAKSSQGNVGHYGADAAMIRDLISFMDGKLAELPLSVVDALEAGISALAMDASMRDERIVDLTSTWQAFDAALQGERTAA